MTKLNSGEHHKCSASWINAESHPHAFSSGWHTFKPMILVYFLTGDTTPAKRIRGRHNLKDLVSRIPENYQSGEIDWGEPVGKEVW
jgi:hypothetical protein